MFFKSSKKCAICEAHKNTIAELKLSHKEQILWYQAQIDTLIDRLMAMKNPLVYESFEATQGQAELEREQKVQPADEDDGEIFSDAHKKEKALAEHLLKLKEEDADGDLSPDV